MNRMVHGMSMMRVYYPHSAHERLDENLKMLKAQVDLKLSADKATAVAEGKLLTEQLLNYTLLVMNTNNDTTRK